VSQDVLRFARPARRWEEAFPLGNGRLGAMVHGGVDEARVQVNDATAWSGRPDGPAVALDRLVAAGVGPGTVADLRAAIDDGRHDDAVRHAQRLQGDYTQAFQPFVDLAVTVRCGPGAEYAGRSLDLRDGVVAERVAAADGSVASGWFASAVDGCLHARWRSDDGTFGLELALTSPHPAESTEPAGGLVGRRLLVELPDDVSPTHDPRGVRFAQGARDSAAVGSAVLLVATDGRAVGTGRGAEVTGATWVEAVLATATSSTWPRPGELRSADVVQDDASNRAAAALPRDVRAGDRAQTAHADEHAGLFGRTTLTLGPPVDLRLPEDLDRAPATTLAQAAFAFGRYLLMAASRPGSPPANLQGVWNQDRQPAWSSGYTLNINLEMAYWAAEQVGLSECHDPLFDHLQVIARHGADVAERLYGVRGWVAHHNSDLWGWALAVGAGVGDTAWASWWSGGTWLCRHLWDRYEHTLDEQFLRDVAWPLMRGAAQFGLDWLRPVGSDRLVPHPSSSPENSRVLDGRAVAMCAGSTMDVALARDLFEHVVEAAQLLGIDDDVAAECAEALPRLPEPVVGPDGLLREWPDGAPSTDPHHRHLSHLVGLYPLDQIDVERTPLVAAAAARSLAARGPGSTGWSMAWKAALHARLGDAVGLGEVVAGALVRAPEHDSGPHQGGLLPNMFSTHPPFQLDGNLGLVAAMAEALLGSSRTELRLLPALPPQWPDGQIVGLRARGALVVDLRWSRGALEEVVLHPSVDGVREIRCRGLVRTVALRAGRPVRLDAGLVERG